MKLKKYFSSFPPLFPGSPGERVVERSDDRVSQLCAIRFAINFILLIFLVNYPQITHLCSMIMHKTALTHEAKAWVKRRNGPDEILRVVPDIANSGTVLCYQLYTAFDQNPDDLGRVLFDVEGYWIYDGDVLSITEQEQVARFIINYTEMV